MKQFIFIVLAAFVSATASAEQQCSKKTDSYYFGKVGLLILDALKEAGVQPKCNDRGCTFAVTDFFSYNETDGCGGGTTGYGTSFTYADGSKYKYDICDGDGSDIKPGKNLGEGLEEVFLGLNLSKISGWLSSVSLAKVECSTNAKEGAAEGTFANCHLTELAK